MLEARMCCNLTEIQQAARALILLLFDFCWIQRQAKPRPRPAVPQPIRYAYESAPMEGWWCEVCKIWCSWMQ